MKAFEVLFKGLGSEFSEVKKNHRREEEPYFFVRILSKREKMERSLSQFNADVGIGTSFENRMIRCYLRLKNPRQTQSHLYQ